MSDTVTPVPIKKKKTCDSCSYEQLNIWRGYDYLSYYCENCGKEATESKPPIRQQFDRDQLKPVTKLKGNIKTRRYG